MRALGKPVELVVFDLDGTLVDSLRDIAGAMNALLRELGLPERPATEFRRIAGDGAKMAVRRATEIDFDTDPARLEALTERYIEIYRTRGSPESRPYTGIRELIDELRSLHSPGAVNGAARGPRLAVLTNKPHEIAAALVDGLFPSRPFMAVEGVRAGTARKPDPGGLMSIVERAGAARERVVYVGDTDTDMKTGRAAGVFTVGCQWGFRDQAELRDAGADAIIAEPWELVGVVE